MVLKKLVVVALVPVAFNDVKFWRVLEPLASNCPSVPNAPKRLVELAVVAKKFVVVALVPVAFTKV